MGRFEQLAEKIATLPIERQDEIADAIERAFNADLNPSSQLSDAQTAIVQARIGRPFDSNIATDEEVAATFMTLRSVSSPPQ